MCLLQTIVLLRKMAYRMLPLNLILSPKPHPLISLFARLLRFLSAEANPPHHLSLSSCHLLHLLLTSLHLHSPLLSFLSLLPSLCKWFPGKEVAHFESWANLPSGCPVAWQDTGHGELLNSSTQARFSQFVPIHLRDFYPPFSLSWNQAAQMLLGGTFQAGTVQPCKHTHTLRKSRPETGCST